ASRRPMTWTRRGTATDGRAGSVARTGTSQGRPRPMRRRAQDPLSSGGLVPLVALAPALDVAGIAAGRDDDSLADPIVALDPFRECQMARHPARLGGSPRRDLAEMVDAEAVEQGLVLLADAADALQVVRNAVPRPGQRERPRHR